MRTRTVTIDVMGLILILSVLYNSDKGYTPLIVVLPVIMVSMGERLKHDHLKIAGLAIFSLLIPYTVDAGAMNETIPIILFVSTLALPLIHYWRSALSPVLGLDYIAAATSVVYFASVFIVFYLLIISLKVDEYLLDVTNVAPQSLVLIASSVLVFMVVLLIGEIRYS